MWGRRRRTKCCETPRLTCIKTVYLSSHDSEFVDRCENCSTHWFRRLHEWVDHNREKDETVWCTRLTEQEAHGILHAERRSDIDLDFLAAREAIIEDSRGVRTVMGQPTYPYS